MLTPANCHVRLRSFDALGNAQLYAMLQLRSAVFVVEQQCIYADIDNADQQALHLLVQHQQQLLAYGRLLQVAPQQVRIGRIIIAADWRGQGHARWLIGLLRTSASLCWPDAEIVLSAQTHLQHLYAKCGFHATSEPYDEDGISHVDMRFA